MSENFLNRNRGYGDLFLLGLLAFALFFFWGFLNFMSRP
jgi:hypothetical protein